MNNEVIDIHVHFGAPRDEESGCYWSKDFEKTAAYYLMLFITHSLFKKVDIKRVLKLLSKAINKSKKVDKSVLLAMDEVYGESGTVHKEWTHLCVPNSYIVKLAQEHERILFGASVHPYREDWSDELDYCLENKAVLCKWIPSSQVIDPSNDKCLPFYRKLSNINLPLLCHTGPEYTIPTSNKKYDKYNNPKYLRKALDEGVTVILAHCGLPYFGFFDVDYQDDLDDFYKLFNEAENNNWKLYTDLSAVATPLRAHYIEKIKNTIPHERILFGSDYPIPASELSYTKSKNIFKWLKLFWDAIHIKNPLDKNYKIIKNMKFDECIFANAADLFSLIKYPN